MELDELMAFLQNKFGVNFTYCSNHNPNSFTSEYKIFANNKFIGVIDNPKQKYVDICYMYGKLWKDDLYNIVLEPCDFTIPKEFKNVHEFAINEIKELYSFLVVEMLINNM